MGSDFFESASSALFRALSGVTAVDSISSANESKCWPSGVLKSVALTDTA